ncbi:DEAD/DEAH box helicase [Xylophilus sp. Leaf220]|uniref:DEAD/DEAH box helicase n=1 Tax=Xylophilus sp. Leaf220 TaxID=1735686 RepID=UPI0006F6B448|nr:DEAD/DEAH box helicase [Xylophilus sp. Leaf220]KQM71122.1 helicase [Xylophilus sp. Leaf220]
MPAVPPAASLAPAPPAAAFRPRLTLRTLGRGDGLLGMAPSESLAPRGDQVTVAQVEWTYAAPGGLRWQVPAPTSVLAPRADAAQDAAPVTRDRAAEADARDLLATLDLRPVPADALQWRAPEAATAALGDAPPVLWTLPQEEQFGDFWADRVPVLQAAGWSVVVVPGFAHQSVPVDAWRLLLDPATGEAQGRELAAPLGTRPAPVVPAGGLALPRREGSWLLTLGIEVQGEMLDLAPLLAELLKRDARWRDAAALAAIDDAAQVRLRAPGGRRIDMEAAPLKAIVGAMLDLLTDPHRAAGPLKLSQWDAERLESLRHHLAASQAQRAGAQGAWALQGAEGLEALAARLARSGPPAPVDVPAGLGVTLRPYQREGLAWLQYLRAEGLGGILADDMGLGKTAQALAHLLVEKQQGRADRPSLVVVPTSLVFNWQAEAARVAPQLKVLALQGADRHAGFAQMAAHDLVVTTYPLAWRDLDRLRPQPWHLLVLDEAQVAKNAASRAAHALRRLQARHRLCLTGTPLENHLGELWAQFDFLMPGFLGDARSFQRVWRKPIEVGGETARAALLARRVRPFVLRRRKDTVATELPPVTEVVERVPLLGQQRDLYESVRVAADKQVRRVLQRTGFQGAQIAVLDALLKLRQVCCDPHLLKGTATPPGIERAKMERLCEMLPAMVEAGRTVLVFSQFATMLRLVDAALEPLGLPRLLLTGSTPPAERGALVQRFQAGDAPILLASLKAGGTGLNLTAADTVIHLDPWWNPAVEAQATARAHRIGQTRPVFVYRMVAEGSIEERMLELQARKAVLADGVLGQDAEAAVKFGVGDLDGLLAPLA